MRFSRGRTRSLSLSLLILSDTIVASGARGAYPHARPTSKVLQDCEFIIFDMGAIVDGYAADMTRTVAGQQESIGERFAQEATLLHPLPAVLPRACVTESARINKFAEVCFERNWYSVLTCYAHRPALVEVYEDRLRIIVDTTVVAEHPRAAGHGQRILDPRHYVELLKRKHRAAASAEVLADGRIPTELHELFGHYHQTDPAGATKKWTQVLALLAEIPAEQLAQTVTRALARGTDDPAAALVPICAFGIVADSRVNAEFLSPSKQLAEHFCALLCPRPIARIVVSLRF